MLDSHHRLALAVALAAPAFLGANAARAAPPALMRFPHASATDIVFVARDELWTVPRSGGAARRLTHDGDRKLMPHFSPDGRWIAYSARHLGRQSVYVMPAEGGAASRLTWFPNQGDERDELVVAWTPDSQAIVFGSRRQAAHDPDYRLFEVPREGGAAVPLAPAQAGLAGFDAAGRTLYFAEDLIGFDPRIDKLGSRGQHLFSLDLATLGTRRLTDAQGHDDDPMPDGNDLYFVSDRGSTHRTNLFVLDRRSGRIRQVTRYTQGSIDFASIGAGAITFQHDGRLVLLDLRSHRLGDVAATLPDEGDDLRHRTIDVSRWRRDTDNLGRPDATLEPSGRRAVLSARGHLFEVDVEQARERVGVAGADADHPSWSPDGLTLAYTVDAGTVQTLVLRATDGTVRRVPAFGSGYLYAPTWSADSRHLAVPDAGRHLWLVGLDGMKVDRVASDPRGAITDPAFSPDGHWLAYSVDRDNQQRAIHLFDLRSGTDHVVSSPFDSDRLPRFTPDGRSLVFVSKRHELTIPSESEHNFATVMAEGVYIASLVENADPLAAGPAPDTGPGSPASTEVDGLMTRVAPVPVDPGAYAALEAVPGAILYLRSPGSWTGGALPGSRRALYRFDLAERKERKLLDDVEQFVCSPGGERVLYRTAAGWRVADAGTGASAFTLATGPLQADIDIAAERRQIFELTWRLDRDLFADGRTTGTWWQAVHDRYARLLPAVASRDDLTWLLRQMQGELASSHTFVLEGDAADDGPPAALPLLGADLAFDRVAGVFQIDRIYRGDNSRPELRSPLTAAGLDIEAGDLLLKVDGRSLPAGVDPYRAFEGLGTTLTLTLQSARTHRVRDVVVQGLRSERALRLNDAILHNRDRVDRRSSGQVAYVYMDDLHSDGLQQFVRQFYPQQRRGAFLFDMRWNRGGYESQPILERLMRRRVGDIVNREGAVTPIPEQAVAPAMATLIGRHTLSDGEQFAHFFLRYRLGPLVGERTAGDVMGVGAPWDLVDGGLLVIPADTVRAEDGRQLIEGRGVAPSIEVRAELVDVGSDAQIDAAVAALRRSAAAASAPTNRPTQTRDTPARPRAR